MKRYKPVHPELRKFARHQFCGFDALERFDEPQRGIFTFDFLPKDFCSKLNEEADYYKLWAKENDVETQPNSMNKYGLLLSDLGLDRWLTHVMRRFVAPLSYLYYDEIKPLRSHYGFLVDYEVGKQRSLAEHFDTSDVTLNVCLGREFDGGAVIFNGKHGKIAVEHEVGRAIVHRGKLLHRATPITNGNRSNLIMWCSTKKGRR